MTIENIILGIYSAVLPLLIAYIIKILKDQKKERDANARGTMLLLRVQLIEYHDRYVEQGSIPSYAYQNFRDMYVAYHALGGNGMVEKMKEEIDELDLKKRGDTHD